ncbi:uncharacterized protein PAC_09611 [Phialocephala subalpina]|uniref:Uncharacterized protein n=1 Tax=Phialocephala subalpina TaxID=576137 RepID=A0A1L7X3Z1_9HELO|nr:uncharacterized protein PAC_09611 [Phialocephala subalpina]
MNSTENKNGKRTRERAGIGFTDNASAKRYEMDYEDGPEIYSSKFIDLQGYQAEMYEDIEKVYLQDEQKRFDKYVAGKMKNEMRREAKLDLEEENRGKLEELKMKLKVDWAKKCAEEKKEEGEEVVKLREELRAVQEKNRMLEEELKALRGESGRGEVAADALLSLTEGVAGGEGEK